MAIESINPATGKRLRSFEPLGEAALDAKLGQAAAAFDDWSRLPVGDRAAVLARAADLLEREKASLGRLMTAEMGKLIGAAEQEAAKCATACRYYAQHAAAFLAPEAAAGQPGGGSDMVLFQPLGAVLAVMPWNFPFWQVVRFAAPALAAGNVGLLKHASNVPGCALALEDLFRRAGAPEGVFQTLLIGAERVAELIADERVAAVTVTGSEGAGREIAAAAGRHIKKTVLELGGSDPFVVLPSADMDAAVETAVKARIVNNGQSCIAAKRFIVVGPAYDEFAPRFVAAMRALKVGDPMARETGVGPLATAKILETLADQVERSVAAGARVLAGGQRLPGPGNYYAPTVLADVPPAAPAFGEELFGPVAALLRARDLDDAIALANATTFGLGASAWTRDRAEAERLARELEAGSVFINGMVASDPRFPFGGVKRSGYGRELGVYGLREFVNVKTVRMTGLP
jgi:succinate-semialdehyde dehydrogenase/glutarate-semialdehyde dehydrogenase